MSELAKTRIDKWLWATRWFKTRTLATDACSAGKVKVEGQNVKPSFQVQVGQVIVFQKTGIKYTIQVENIIEKRVGAPQAQTCYIDLTPPEDKERLGSSFTHHFEIRDRGIGRPTKKDRREIEKFKSKEEDNQ
ncbi:MAG: RNA-binding S4 domain-containing protein [Chitinophagales bacterium]|nr:RNA-binding S4 domain-containing protein [Chitinophagales bacterium]MCZ2394161.1 RNA-binding S4 domain-containing protein [Chitinophagales bacterium]